MCNAQSKLCRRLSIFIFIIILYSLNYSVASYAKDSVNIDYSMVEQSLKWLDLIKSGADSSEIKEYFMQNIAPTPGCKSIIQHWARFTEWNNEKFYKCDF